MLTTVSAPRVAEDMINARYHPIRPEAPSVLGIDVSMLVAALVDELLPVEVLVLAEPLLPAFVPSL